MSHLSVSVRPTYRLRTTGGFKRKFTEVGWRFPIASPQTKSTSNSYLSCSGLLFGVSVCWLSEHIFNMRCEPVMQFHMIFRLASIHRIGRPHFLSIKHCTGWPTRLCFLDGLLVFLPLAVCLSFFLSVSLCLSVFLSTCQSYCLLRWVTFGVSLTCQSVYLL